MSYISFEEMPVWKKAMELAIKVFELTEKLPRKEDYGLTSQIRRSTLSISGNIGEGSGQDTNKAFDRYLGIAVGSAFEVVSGMFLALDRGYIDVNQHKQLYDEGEILAKSKKHQQLSQNT